MVAIAAITPWSTVARAADPIVPGDLVGRFRYVGGAREEQTLRTAIGVLSDEMNFLIRSYAKRKLEETNQVPRVIGFGLVGPSLQVEIPGLPTITAPTDGSRVKWKDQFGDDVKLRQRIKGRRLVQQFVGAQGSRDIVYQLAPDGERLSFAVKISSKHLPWPLRYRLSYRRAG